MSIDNKTEEQRHYDSLIVFFKYLVSITIGAITLLAGVGLFTTYQSLSDARKEVNENLEIINKKIEEQTEKSLISFQTIQNQSREEVQNFKEETKNYAINETKMKVEEAFEQDNIQRLVEKTAEDKLSSKLGVIVEYQVSLTKIKIEEQMKILSTLSLAIDKIRWGERVGLQKLDSLRKYSEDELIRDLADKSFLEKAKDYEDSYKQHAKQLKLKDYRDMLKIDKSIIESDKEAISRSLVAFIQSSQNLNDIAYAICILNNLNDKNFEMFDFQAIDNWAKIELNIK